VGGRQSKGDGHGSLLARQVILATDAPNTATILENSPDLQSTASTIPGVPPPSAPPPKMTDLYWPRGTATAIVRLWFDTTPRAGSEAGILSGDFVPDNFFWLHRIQDAYIRWHRATGGSALEAHIYGPPMVLEEPDTLLLTRTIADVQSIFPELRGHQIHQVLRRNQPTHTLPSVGPANRHLGIETPWPDLFCCGDWVRHPTPAFFMERACVTGIEAANAVLRSRDLMPWRLLDYPQPEPLAAFMERLMLRGRRSLRKRQER
jgi:isorenieratene synthase